MLLAYLEELNERGLKKSDIARLLGVHRSVVSRLFNGSAPLELRTVGQLAWAMDREARFTLPKRKASGHRSNFVKSNSTTDLGPLTTAVDVP